MNDQIEEVSAVEAAKKEKKANDIKKNLFGMALTLVVFIWFVYYFFTLIPEAPAQ